MNSPDQSEITTQQIESLLKSLPGHRAPEHFASGVMDNILKQEPSFSHSFVKKLTGLFTRKMTISFTPARALAATACVFALMFFTFSSFEFTSKKQLSLAQTKLHLLEKSAAEYATGKALLAMGQFKQAVPYLAEAAKLRPTHPDYHFWLGVTYGNLEDFPLERQAYAKAISLRPDHLMSQFYLGHTYVNEKNWPLALAAYEKVLNIDPGFEKALYNRALVLQYSASQQKALAAWKNYLAVQDTGINAFNAVHHLNMARDFTYRIFQIGRKKTIIGPLTPDRPESRLWVSKKAIQKIGRMLLSSPDLELHILVNSGKTKQQAQDQALAVKNEIISRFQQIPTEQIKTSWFNEKETIKTDQNIFSLEQSIRFLGIKKQMLKKGVHT